MLTTFLIGVIVASGAPLAVVAATGLALAAPRWFLAGVVAIGVVRRVRSRGSSRPEDEVAFLHGVAAELRAGASLRRAVAAGAARTPALPLAAAVRRAGAGRPIAEVASGVRAALPVTGRLCAACLDVTAATGARAADLFSRLAARAAVRAELARERRALTAQARLSALVVGGGPLAVASLVVASGNAPGASDPAGVALLVGSALVASGAAVMWWMIRRAER